MQINPNSDKFMQTAQTHGWLERVVVRHCREHDLPEMEWEGEFAKFRRIYANVYQRTIYGQAIIWVAILPEVGVVGQVMLQLEIVGRPELADGQRVAYLHSFRIRPAFRNVGLGERMMQVVETDIVERGFEKITLNVIKENSGALRLYQRLGYEVAGTDAGKWSYVDDQGVVQHVHEPGWRMHATLK